MILGNWDKAIDDLQELYKVLPGEQKSLSEKIKEAKNEKKKKLFRESIQMEDTDQQ